ncbi:hypothetical protein Y032_0901g2953 [Ancylostoma ceylanicum]|uniref:Uncharacterized protein n=1 Tax=Ancylostoma ceylanicum TaxID=53326 RepID=A0A016W9R8_9BILA|nr:hypothetical protein Y032_0901g2953 [Ancylostoma ceylanicum]
MRRNGSVMRGAFLLSDCSFSYTGTLITMQDEPKQRNRSSRNPSSITYSCCHPPLHCCSSSPYFSSWR